MEDKGNILYIILTILFLVISALAGKKKKPGGASASQGHAGVQKKPFETFFTEDDTEEEETIVKEYEMPFVEDGIGNKNEVEEVFPTYAQEIYDTVPPEEGVSLLHAEKSESPEFDGVTQQKKNLWREEFDLKKAVIFSEILTRKYF